MKAIEILFGAMVAVLSVPALAQSPLSIEAERDQANPSTRNNYPASPCESTKTHADVIIELEAARLGKPALSMLDKLSCVGRPPQGKDFEALLYNGA